MQYIPLEYNNNNNNNNNNIKHSGMVLRSNEMLLSHFKRNWDAIPPHPTPPQALCIPYSIHTQKMSLSNQIMRMLAVKANEDNNHVQ
jgi:hypothetical protein